MTIMQCFFRDASLLTCTRVFARAVLVVTAKGSGAEIIPFLKTYVNLPGAIGFTVLYSKLTNKCAHARRPKCCAILFARCP